MKPLERLTISSFRSLVVVHKICYIRGRKDMITSQVLLYPLYIRRSPRPFTRLDDLTVLKSICSLEVPNFMRTTFIFIIDDPTVGDKDMQVLTQTLQKVAAPNACRVRQNEVCIFNITGVMSMHYTQQLEDMFMTTAEGK